MTSASDAVGDGGAGMTLRPHTPGPWKWDKHGDLRGKDGNAIVNPNLRGDVLSGVNREADAALIAAAPSLLAALKNAHGILQFNLGDVDPHVRSACDLMWAAINEVESQ